MFDVFISSFLIGILFIEFFNQYSLGGFKLGFWFAQQGSMYVFVILIFVYVFLMNRLDKKFDIKISYELDLCYCWNIMYISKS